MKKITRVALITSGGDCQGLNAAMRGIGKALHNKVENLEIFGMYDGYRGLVDGDYKFMEPKDFRRHTHSGRHHSRHLAPALYPGKGHR